jgi:hypothetical protein
LLTISVSCIDKLKAGGRQVSSGVVDWSEVWVKPTGTYINISQTEAEVTSQHFTKQACFIGMGKQKKVHDSRIEIILKAV